MLNSRQCQLLLKIIDEAPFKGRAAAKEIIAISDEIEKIQKQAIENEKSTNK